MRTLGTSGDDRLWGAENTALWLRARQLLQAAGIDTKRGAPGERVAGDTRQVENE